MEEETKQVVETFKRMAEQQAKQKKPMSPGSSFRNELDRVKPFTTEPGGMPMPIADKMVGMVEAASMIRKMFEEGIRMREEFGADKVYDFSLGNPDVPPPAAVKETLLDLINDPAVSHGYMPNPGFPHVRKSVADYLSKEFNCALTPDLVVMTVGAAGALNDCLRALMNPGEELLTPAPYFVGYNQYAYIANAQLKTAPSLADFHLDLEAIEAAITEKTRVVLVNSPNNPTGTVYTAEELAGLGKILDAASEKYGRRIYLISDEPYRKIVYDAQVPSMFDAYDHTIVLTLLFQGTLPGWRTHRLPGHQPKAEDAQIIAAAAGVTNTMMYVNARHCSSRWWGGSRASPWTWRSTDAAGIFSAKGSRPPGTNLPCPRAPSTSSPKAPLPTM